MPKNKKIIICGILVIIAILIIAGIIFIKVFYSTNSQTTNLPTGLPTPYPVTVFLKSDQAIQEINNIQNEYVAPGFTYEKFVIVQAKMLKGDLKNLIELLKIDPGFMGNATGKNNDTLIIYYDFDGQNNIDDYIEKDINNFSSTRDSYDLNIISQKPYPILAYFLLPGGADERETIKKKLYASENIDKVCENFMLECLINY